MKLPMRDRLAHAWDAFKSRDPVNNTFQYIGPSSYAKPDRAMLKRTSERSIVASIYNKIAIDVAAIGVKHVRIDENDRYLDTIKSKLNECLTVEANLDQTGRALMLDIVISLFDEGVVAVVPTETSLNPSKSSSYEILSLRTGQIVEWFPSHVRVKVYNEKTGNKEELILPKKTIAIIENPLYAVMNEPNSTLKRLIHKLNILDTIDQQTGSGKLDLIIQLPYVIKSEARREQAEKRRKDIEVQLAGSKYGVAYTDGTEKITQLNRPVENNLLTQIEYLTSMLHSQLGMTPSIFDGTADEHTMLNYYNRTIEPVLDAITEEMKRKFLTKTARTQGQSIGYFRNAFKLVPVTELANIADTFTRNEVLSSNEIRAIIGFKPSKDPTADELRNKNLNVSKEEEVAQPPEEEDV